MQRIDLLNSIGKPFLKILDIPERLFLKGRRYKFLESMRSELAEGFLELLLNLMKLTFMLDWKFRKNIRNFTGRYLFRSRDNRITVSAIIENGRMKVHKKSIDTPHITVIFKDARALRNFLLSPKPDIIDSVLRQDITLDGNLNYLYKFAYMARHLQLRVTGG